MLPVTTASEIHLHRDDFIKAIAKEASGERVLDYFGNDIQYQGFAPSKGYDAILKDAAAKLKSWGYDEVELLGFPSDGDSYVWAFRTDPAWDVDEAELSMVRPRQVILARFSQKKMCLARFSGPTDLTAPLIHVGEGVSPANYRDMEVKGKIVLAWGTPHVVFKQAVWERGALGMVWYRLGGEQETADATQVVYSLPWKSYERGEPVTFCFSIAHTAAQELIALLDDGEEVVLHALVRAKVRPSQLHVATGVIKGTEFPEEEVWLLGHCNHRNTGGFNNLSGFGATKEIARVLAMLIQNQTLPPPRRTIRFFWGPEHNAVIAYFFHHPEIIERVFGVVNLDMVGGYRSKTGARLTMRRTPHSTPHFINDVGEFFVDYMAQRNEVDSRYVNILVAGQNTGFADPVLAPTGSKASFNVRVAEYWGPSDQEDLLDGSIRVPTVSFLEWPDPFFHTDMDDIELLDPTQLRRVIAMAGAFGYYLAQMSAADLPLLIVHALGKARARNGKELSRAAQMVQSAKGADLPEKYREAVNFLVQAGQREQEALRSLVAVDRRLGDYHFFLTAIDRLDQEQEDALRTLRALAAEKCAAQGIDAETLSAPAPADPYWAEWKPQRVPEIRGPINLHRHQYGQWWLYERLGHLDFTSLPLALDGQYYPFEALNSADGERTVREIRDLVCAEYEPVPLEHFYSYFELLAKVGAIWWRKKE